MCPNFELNDDDVATIPILTQTASGTTVPDPDGDTFTVASSSPSLGVAIGTSATGGPAVVLTPLVQASPNITVTVSDSAGLTAFVQLVDIVADLTPKNVVLDIADAVLTPQTAPTAAGP